MQEIINNISLLFVGALVLILGLTLGFNWEVLRVLTTTIYIGMLLYLGIDTFCLIKQFVKMSKKKESED